MKSISRRWWVLILLAFAVAGCAPAQEISPTTTPSVVQIDITPAAWSVHPAVAACDAALPDILVEVEERFATQTKGDLLIRLGAPGDSPNFLAQIASDDLVVILHPENKAASLTPTEIQEIFTGQVTNWSDYNGSDAPVRVWVPLSADETRVEFDSQILQGLPVVSDARLAPDPQAMQQAISADPNAIGFLPNSWQPTGFQSILLGLRMPVLVAASQIPEGPAAELVACLQGETGQQALKEFYPKK